MNIISFIKKIIPLKLKKTLIQHIYTKKIILPKKERAFIFLAADYGNIGDIAITHAQENFLRKTLPKHQTISIPISSTRHYIKSIKKQINTNDIVTIVGGGNMGSLYPDIEELRQLVIRSFPNNRIICFPQTLDWDESKKSLQTLKQISNIYSKHSDIHLFARESISYKKLNELFKSFDNVHIALVPDIVMSTTAETLGTLDCSAPEGILRCLRNDKESALTASQYDHLDKILVKTGYSIFDTDTHAGGSQLDTTYCSKLLADKLSQFRAAKLVVTDRLHGMILCLLSGTPCLVLPNSNHKIRQTWLDWLQHHTRLIFVEPAQFDEIPNFINQLLSEPRGALNESPVDMSKYNLLKQALTLK